MPVYVYHCDKCLRHFEIFQHFTDDSLTVCPECGEPTVQKQYQPTPIHFKGQGWHYQKKYTPEKQA